MLSDIYYGLYALEFRLCLEAYYAQDAFLKLLVRTLFSCLNL